MSLNGIDDLTSEQEKKARAAFNLATAIESQSGTGQSGQLMAQKTHLCIEIIKKELSAPEREFWLEWCSQSGGTHGALNALRWLKSGWESTGMLPSGQVLRQLARARNLGGGRDVQELAALYKFILHTKGERNLDPHRNHFKANLKEPFFKKVRKYALSLTRSEGAWIPSVKMTAPWAGLGSLFMGGLAAYAFSGAPLISISAGLFGGGLLGIGASFAYAFPHYASSQSVLNAIFKQIYGQSMVELEKKAWIALSESLGGQDFEQLAQSFEKAWRSGGGSIGNGQPDPIKAFFDVFKAKVNQSIDLNYLIAQKEQEELGRALVDRPQKQSGAQTQAL